MKNEKWKKFEKTGCVSDYLDYVQLKADTADKEGAKQNEPGDCDWEGFVGDADWRV